MNTHIVNGQEVPAPVSSWDDLTYSCGYRIGFILDGIHATETFVNPKDLFPSEIVSLDSGNVFKTEQDALANAKALYGESL